MHILKHRDFEIVMPDAKEKVGGHFLMQRIKNGVVIEEREFDNLITNLGMDRLLGSTILLLYEIFGSCHVGTGTATPTNTDAALGAYVAGVTAPNGTNSVVTSTPRYGEGVLTYTFALGALNGNYTEVGIAGQAATGTLFSRALILDGVGAPTSITILSDEQLRVVYTLRFYVNETDVVNTGIVITGAPDTPYDVTMRRGDVNTISSVAPAATNIYGNYNSFGALGVAYQADRAYTGSLGAITATSPGGTYLGFATTVTPQSYTAASFERNTLFEWSPSAAVGTIKSLRFAYGSAFWQAEFDVGIVKSSLFTFAFTHRVVLARR